MTSAWYFLEPLRNETRNFLISKLCFPWLVYTLMPSNSTHYYLISSNLPFTTKTTKKFPAWRRGCYELFRYSQWQMATDFNPTFQTKYHEVVVPKLLQVLEDNGNPRVQAHAAAALVNFSESHCMSDVGVLCPWTQGRFWRLCVPGLGAIDTSAEVLLPRWSQIRRSRMSILLECSRNKEPEHVAIL